MTKLSSTILILSLFAVVALGINVDKYTDPELTETQAEELFSSYMAMAPYFVDASFERYRHFQAQIKEIIAHNIDGASTWKRAVNRYTGLFAEEIIGYAIMAPQTCKAINSFEVSLFFDVGSDSFDWRALNVVSPVKNQGNCASSWAFAATGAIESHASIIQGAGLMLLSEQQLLDCASHFGNQGCTNGLPSSAYEYVAQIGGINSENNYPYVMQAEDCLFNSSVVAAVVNQGSINITAGDESAIMTALVQYGPISVVFDATSDFLSYNGGVYVGKTCGQTAGSVNFAGLIVGYGTDATSGLAYWIVKTSMGSGWGESGYARIQKGVDMCGISQCASFPNMSKNTGVTA